MIDLNLIKNFFPEQIRNNTLLGKSMLKEYIQLLILDYLSTTQYVRKLTFIGRTCLRLLKGIDRFSEDQLFNKENNQHFMDIKGCMLSDAAQLTVKVAGAVAAGLYDLKMESAAIIRKAARDLMVQQHSLESFEFEYVEYYQIVRDLIEEYRLLFIDRVAKFDKWDYVIDRWGLFNPPGVGPFDKDPDDDIPFHGFEKDPDE
jgi:hypothetical protein